MVVSEMLPFRRDTPPLSLRRLVMLGISAIAGGVLIVLFGSIFADPSASAADEHPSRIQQTTDVTDVNLVKSSSAPTKSSHSNLLTQLSTRELLPIDDAVAAVEATTTNVTDAVVSDTVVSEKISPILSPQLSKSAETDKAEDSSTTPIVSLNTGTNLLKSSGETAQKLASEVLATSATAAAFLDKPQVSQDNSVKTLATQTPRNPLSSAKALKTTRIPDVQQDTVKADEQSHHRPIPNPEKNDALPLGLTNLGASPGAGVGHDNGGSRSIPAVSPYVSPLNHSQLIETIHHDQGQNVVKYNDLPDTPPD